jgi:hypothetical protein
VKGIPLEGIPRPRAAGRTHISLDGIRSGEKRHTVPRRTERRTERAAINARDIRSLIPFIACSIDGAAHEAHRSATHFIQFWPRK